MIKKFSVAQKTFLKGASTSCLLVCSLALAQYVEAEENALTAETSATIASYVSGSSETAASSAVVPETSISPTSEEATVPVVDENIQLDEIAATEDVVEQPTEELAVLVENTAETTATETAPKANNEVTENIYLSPDTVYMDSTNELDISLPTTTPITWSIEGLPSNTYVIKTGKFEGDAVLSTTTTTTDNQTNYHLTIQPLFGEDLSLRWPTNIRRTYRDYIGSYTLKGVSQDGKTIITKELMLRPYENYMSHDELMDEIKDIEEHPAADRLVTVETIGTSTENRPIKMGIIAKDQASIDHYLSQTTPLMLTNPDQAMKLLAEGKFDYKLPILINNTHADEQPGIDVVRGLFKEFAQKSIIRYQTVDENDQPKEVTIDVLKLLEKVILLFNFTENPDGDVNNTRALTNGLDPNRDTSYQTNPETKAIVEQMTKWNPIAVFDVHGFVKDFLIEPATPPHDPNFEYDIFEEDLVADAHAMGRAGITNSKYEGYIIPKFDYGSGWDDSFSGYTAVYALYHGILGHTIEIPETNQESYKAGFFAVLAGIDYDLKNSDKLMRNRLRYYSHGVNKVEDPAAEEPLVTVDGSVKGRIKGEHETFFPDYYVIPMELSALQMMSTKPSK